MMDMRKTIARAMLVAAVVLFASWPLWAADAVTPESASITNLRGEAQARVSTTVEYYRGTSLLLTNNVMYSGTSTSAAVQGLDDVDVVVSVGTTESSVAYTGTVLVATSGTWYVTITVPTNLASAFLQVKITDAESNSYIYPWKTISTLDPLD